MDDYEIRRNIWDSGIPIEFRLESDLTHSDKPFFAIFKRIEYFPTSLGKVLQFFSSTLNGLDANAEPWLSCNGSPLKWHYPIGVLFDVHSSSEELPWVVTLKLKDFPDELIRKDAMKNCYLQSVKEADQLKYKGQIVSGMKAEEHSKLFDSLCNSKFDDFWSVNRKLIHSEEHKIQHVPLKFYHVNKPLKQSLVSTHTPEEVEITLESVIKELYEEEYEHLEVISHGVTLPKQTPLIWLAKNLVYPDNFVHLVVKSI